MRSELVLNRWRLPFATTAPDGVDLDALAVWVEGRYKLTPRVSIGFRADRLGFSDVTTAAAGQSRICMALVDRYATIEAIR